MVMPSNNTGIQVGYLAGRFPGFLGHLFSPGAERGPYGFMPYALDNGAFTTFKHGKEWRPEEWIELLEWAKLSGQRPLWTLVPDAVADREATIANWSKYAPVAARYGWPLAFAVQDGMVPSDVPLDADVVFVGGTTLWKWATVKLWCGEFERAHVGRVNTYKRLIQSEEAGAESVDGSGWFRGDQRQYRDLVTFLEESSGARSRHAQLHLTEAAS